jgi:hypothetical protein
VTEPPARPRRAGVQLPDEHAMGGLHPLSAKHRERNSVVRKISQ